MVSEVLIVLYVGKNQLLVKIFAS